MDSGDSRSKDTPPSYRDMPEWGNVGFGLTAEAANYAVEQSAGRNFALARGTALAIGLTVADLVAAAKQGDWERVTVKTAGIAGGVLGGLLGGLISSRMKVSAPFGIGITFTTSYRGQKAAEQITQKTISASQKVLRELEKISAGISHRINPANSIGIAECFEASTKILLADGTEKPISEVEVGDTVLAFDGSANLGRGALCPRRVKKVFSNTTSEFVRLSWIAEGKQRDLVATPGHHFLAVSGDFPELGNMIKGGRAALLSRAGEILEVLAETITYCAETAHYFERAEAVNISSGSSALVKVSPAAWKTYNFEVEDLHTYVAEGIRVHNISAPWAHTTEIGIAAAVHARYVANVPLDYAISLGRSAMAFNDPSYGKSDPVGYTSAGRAISIDKTAFNTFLAEKGGSSASAKDRAAAAAVGAMANGHSRTDAFAVAYNIAQKNGVETDGVFDSYVRRQMEQPTGGSGKGGGAEAISTPSRSGSISGTSAGAGKTSSRDSASGSSGSSGKSGGGDSTPANSGKSSSSKSSGNNNSSSSSSGKPVLLDLNGDGRLDLSDQANSDIFLDIGGDGYKRRTSWVGAGDGVLMIDADNDGTISSRKEIVFTEWSPSAGSDMQALRQVFDTNQNGKLDAGDAQWSQFKIMLTNADGTVTQKSLAELGIESIDLSIDETRIDFDGGSSIDGQTTFTRTNGQTGTAATATLKHDDNGFAVSETRTVDASGSVTVVTKAHDKDGRLASETTKTTSASGLDVTMRFDDNGDGVVDRVLTDVTTIGQDGARTRTETMRNGGGTLLWSRTSDLSADGKTTVINRDELGGGYTTERETRVIGSDNSLTTTIAQLAQNGDMISQTSSALSADRLSRTFYIDANGNGQNERITEHQTIRYADGGRFERDLTWGADWSLLRKEEVAISADNLTQTRFVDLDGDAIWDNTFTSLVSRNQAGDTTVREASFVRDGAKYKDLETTTSADGLSRSIREDVDGDGTFDRRVADLTSISADGTKTRTITNRSASGHLLSQTTEQRHADGLTGSNTVDSNGDGHTDQLITVSRAADGTITETNRILSADGSVASESLKETSADGLVSTSKLDRHGRGRFDEITLSSLIRQADGSSTRTLEKRSENSTLVNRIVESSNATGLSTSKSTDVDGNGSFDQVISANKTQNADGSETLITENRSGDGTLISKEENWVTADKRGKLVRTDSDGDGNINTEVGSTIGADGGEFVENRSLTNTGTLLSRTTTVTSANKLNIYQTVDFDGDGIIDRVHNQYTDLPADGSSYTSRTTSANDGSVIRQDVKWVSGNGMNESSQSDLNGDWVYDETTNRNTAVEDDGTVRIIETKLSGSSIASRSTVRTSANGLISTAEQDFDGDNAVDDVTRTTKSLLENGAVIETVTKRSGNNELVSSTSKTTSSDGMSIVQLEDVDGDGITDYRTEQTIAASGNSSLEVKELGQNGEVLSRTATTTLRGGLSSTQVIDRDGDGTVDETRTSSTTIDAYGVKTTQTSRYQGSSTLLERATVTETTNGLSKSTVYADGNTARLRSVNETTEILQNGSTRQTTEIRKGDLSLESKTVVLTSGDKQSIVTSVDVDGDGKIDHSLNQELLDNGVSRQTFVEMRPDGIAADRSKTVEMSTNKLVETTTFDANGDGASDGRIIKTKSLKLDGGATTTTDYQTNVNGNWVTKGKEEHSESGNGLTQSTSWNDAGGSGWTASRSLTQSLHADGSRTAVETWQAAATTVRRTETTVSANGMGKTVQVDADGNGTFDEKRVTNKTFNSDGTIVETSRTTGVSDALLSLVSVTTSADGLTTTTRDQSALVPAATRTTVRSLREKADGSQVETATVRDGSNAIIETITAETSFDKRLLVTKRDQNGDGTVDQIEETKRTIDGREITTITNFRTTGTVSSKSVDTVSADRLTRIIEIDKNGDGAFDTKKTLKSYLYADGSKEVTTTELELANGKTRSTSKSTTSADGRRFLEETDVDGNGSIDQTVEETSLASGARVTKVTNTAAARKSAYMRFGEIYWNNATPAASETTANANQMTKTSKLDQDGDGYFETVMKTSTLIDGSVKTDVTETKTDGTVKARGSFRMSHDGSTTVLEKDSNNDGVVDYVETSIRMTSGAVVQTAVTKSAAGVDTETRTTNVDAFGSILTSITKDASGRKIAEQNKLADGTSTRLTYVAESGWVKSSEVLDSFNFLKSATLYDRANAEAWSRVEQTYDGEERKTLEKQLMDDGTSVTISFVAATGAQIKAEYFNASGVRTGLVDFDTGNTESWREVHRTFDAQGRVVTQIDMQDDGSKVEYTFDVANTESWSRYMNRFDSAGRHFYAHRTNDSGTYDTITFDVSNVQPWTKLEQAFDSSGRETIRIEYWDNGNRTYSDVSGTQAWSRIEQVFAGPDQISTSTMFIDDGSVQKTIFDVSNSYNWKSITVNFVDVNSQHVRSPQLLRKDWDNGDYQLFVRSQNGTTDYTYTSSGQLKIPPHFWDGMYVVYDTLVNRMFVRPTLQPVAIDLNDDQHLDLRPLDVAQFNEAGIQFDWDGDGSTNTTAWVGPQDGFLAIDLAADGSTGPDGMINQAKELAFTLWPTEEQGSTDSDLEAVRLVFDTNNDGLLSAEDARWSEFRVWQDINQNGVSEAGELSTLDQLGIKYINLIPTADGAQNFADGSAITGTSFLEKVDGQTRLVGDVRLAYQPSSPT
ncbi:Hint domain-containing protein [Agrobacterium sp. LAD9]|uniref:Hint domain-containing protein n=1 Tax=Agrobacterium sp. LAD9 TaxID=2055153 RepID=UPI000D1ED472|nr:Hint domain-containing protein [Agrobacterium sp. LAD9]